MTFTSALESARGGSELALGTLLESCQGYIHTVATRQLPRKLQNRIRPSSLVQETYLRACRGFDGFRGDSEQQLLAWLRQILLHCLVSLLRRPEFRVSVAALDPALIGRSACPVRAAADAECARDLTAALGRLPGRYRLVIELRHFGGLSFDELGVALGCSSEAARKVWVRAQAQLGEELQPHR